MHRSTLCALLFSVLLLSALPLRVKADEYDDDLDTEDVKEAAGQEDSVKVLTDANFADTIANNKYVLAEFYASWCGHCKKLAPEYAAAAKMLKEKDPSIVLGKLEATEQTATAKLHNIKGYPTIKWFVNGEAVEYNGPRDANGIVAWVLKKAGPTTRNVEDTTKLAEVEKENEVVVLGHFKSLEGADVDAFRKIGESSEDVVLVETTNADVAKAAGLTGSWSSSSYGFSIIKNFKGEPRETATYTGKVDGLKDFITAEKLPLTLEFTQANTDKIFSSGINKQVIMWAKPADLADDAPAYVTFKEVAKKMKGKLVFVTVDNEGPTHSPVTKFFGLADTPSPSVVGFFMEGNKKYKLVDEYNLANLEKFCQGVVDGTAHQEFKSASAPEKATDDDGVTTVVGKTVDSIVKDPTKDVLLEVYAPWCGHCKALEPIYKKLGKRFKKIDSVVIAKMDGTENEHPDIQATGYPSIYIIPAEKDAKPIPFEGGDRSLKTLTKFIKEHAQVPYELPKKSEGEVEGEGDAKDEL